MFNVFLANLFARDLAKKDEILMRADCSFVLTCFLVSRTAEAAGFKTLLGLRLLPIGHVV